MSLKEKLIYFEKGGAFDLPTNGRKGRNDKSNAKGATKIKEEHSNHTYISPPRSPTTSTTTSEISLVSYPNENDLYVQIIIGKPNI